MMLLALLSCVALAQGPTVPLAGVVVGDGDAPVSGAEVLLTGLSAERQVPIVARGRADERGEFRIERPANLAAENSYRVPILWAFAPGRRASMTRFEGAIPGPDVKLRLVLGPPARSEIRVKGPDGRPVAGATVRVTQVHNTPGILPEELIEPTAAKTDADGLAIIGAFPPESMRFATVTAEGLGLQQCNFGIPSAKPRDVALSRVAALRGRLVADDPKLAEGWNVRAYANPSPTYEAAGLGTGYGEATTDDRGEFSIPVIGVGRLGFDIRPPEGADLPVLPEIPVVPGGLAVRPEGENAVEIPLKPAAKVAGLVRERGKETPVTGMAVSLSPVGRGGMVLQAKSDDRGRYSFRVLPGKVRVDFEDRGSAAYVLAPGQSPQELVAPEGGGDVEARPWEVEPAASLRGIVRDEAGNPAPGVSVTGQWSIDGGSSREHRGGSSALSDAQGRFVLNGLAPGAGVSIRASRGDRVASAPVNAKAGQEQEVEVAIGPADTISFAGRVLDPEGKPIEEAVIRIESEQSGPNPQRGWPDYLERLDFIQTGADGGYRTPAALSQPGWRYRAVVTATDFLPSQTPFVFRDGEGKVVALPDLVLDPAPAVREVAGAVLDRAGMPIAGAKVSQSGDGPEWTTTTTDERGEFRLGGVYKGPALAFAEKDGFRFGGAIVGPDGRAEVRLARPGEPPVAAIKALPPPLSRAEEKALARKLLEPLIPLANRGTLRTDGTSLFPVLARVDPDRVLAMIENRVLPDSRPALTQAILGIFEDNPAEALALVDDTGPSAEGFLELADLVPAADRGRRDELLDRAVAEARRGGDPGSKLRSLRAIARRWLRAGDIGRATPLLREGQGIIAKAREDAAAEVSKDARAFVDRSIDSEAEGFAEVLAAIDLPAALALLDREGVTRPRAVRRGPDGTLSTGKERIGGENPGSQVMRGHQDAMARSLAAIKPAEAERLILGGEPIPEYAQSGRLGLILDVCRKMATKDLPRARKLLGAGLADPKLPAAAKPYGLGLMAGELASPDPESARKLLDEAFDGLRRVAEAEAGREPYVSTACAMADLLPVVERVDPDRLAERLWLAASCRPARRPALEANDIRARTQLALAASRYDRGLAAAIYAPARARTPELTRELVAYAAWPGWVKDLAGYDPAEFGLLVEQLPALDRGATRLFGGGEMSTDAQVRMRVAESLGKPPEARRRANSPFGGGSFGLWPLPFDE